MATCNHLHPKAFVDWSVSACAVVTIPPRRNMTSSCDVGIFHPQLSFINTGCNILISYIYLFILRGRPTDVIYSRAKAAIRVFFFPIGLIGFNELKKYNRQVKYKWLESSRAEVEITRIISKVSGGGGKAT